MTVLDLFAGPGGWSVALARLGLPEFGVEWNPDACATARAAGHHRLLGDVRAFEVEPARFDGLIASPPCQTFSQAGSGSGRRDLDRLLAAVDVVAEGATPLDALGNVNSGLLLDDAVFGNPEDPDERSALVLEPMRAIRDGRPEWVAFEQVPSVLPIWEAYARALRRLGYSAATGVLNAEAYGVPQTRRRAILVASRARDVELPRPTHSRYYSREPERLDPGVLPWVSMAEALGWAEADSVGFPRLADDQDAVEIGGVSYRARDLREARNPSQTVTEKARSWTRFPTAVSWLDRFRDQSGSEYDPSWPAKRPVTTIAGRGLVGNPGVNANRFNGSTKSRNDGVRVSDSEAGVLQGFPLDYPWQGSSSARYQQVGDAMPPDLAEAVIRAAASDLICPECGNDTTVAGERFCPECLEDQP